MGALQAATFAWRLTVEGAEAVVKAFTDVGKAADKGMKDTSKSTGGATNALVGLTKQLGGMEKQAVAMDKLRRQLILLAGAGGIGMLVNNSLEAAVNIKKMAGQAGMAVEPYQELVFALQSFNIEQGTATSAMTKFSRETAEFIKHNSGPAKEVYETLFGANAQDVAQRGMINADKFFIDVLSRIGKLGNEAEKLDLLSKLYGKDGGAQLIEAANAGTRAIEEQMEMARQLGIVYSKDMVEGADEAQRKIEVLTTVLKTKLQMAIVDNADSIAKLAQAGIDNLPAVLKIFEAIATAAETIQKAIASVTISMANVPTAAKNFGDWYAKLSGQPTLENLMAITKLGEGTYDPQMPWEGNPDPANPGLKITVRPKGAGGGSGVIPKGDDDRVRRTKSLSDAYEKLVFNLNAEIDALGKSEREQAISNELRKLGADATDEQRASIEALAGRLYDEAKAYDMVNDAARRAGDMAVDKLQDILFKAESAKDGLKGLAAAFLEMAWNAMVGDQASEGIKGLLSGGISMLTGGGFGGGSAGAGGWDLGAWAGSGSMPSFAVGTDYVPYDMVAQIHKGERIIPASQNMGGGWNITVEDHAGVNVSAHRGRDGVVLRLTQLEEAMQDLNRSIEPRSVAAVQQSRQRSVNF